MKPILFRLFDFAVPSYSVMMVLGYIVALGVLMKLTPSKPEGAAERGGLERAQVWDLFIVMVVSSVLGSKIGHVLFEAPGHKIDESGAVTTNLIDLLKADPWHWARLGESGYVWYGGLIGALLIAVIYFRNRPHLSAWLYCDTFAPAIVAGAVIGRLGCFLAGCCYGKPTDSFFGVQFPGMSGPVHPTQLYDALSALVLSAVLLVRYPRRRFDGEGIAVLLMGYAVLRAFTEAFRGDADRGSLGALSTSQILSIPMFLAGFAIFFVRSRAKPAAAAGPATPAGSSSPTS